MAFTSVAPNGAPVEADSLRALAHRQDARAYGRGRAAAPRGV
jgi:hypothetical protein